MPPAASWFFEQKQGSKRERLNFGLIVPLEGDYYDHF